MGFLPRSNGADMDFGPIADSARDKIEAGAKLQMVKVTNKNDFVMRDMYDGMPYTFATNEPLSIPPAAAAHFFGWPGDADLMKLHTCRRFGWNRPEHIGADKTKPQGEQLANIYWGNLLIEEVNFRVVPERDASLPDMGQEEGTMTERDPAPTSVGEVALTHVGEKRRPGRPRKAAVS